MKIKLIAGIVFIATIFQQCTKNECTEKKEVIRYTATYKPMASLRTVQIQGPKAFNGAGKIFVKGNYIFLNEPDKGFHIIDNTNKTNPRPIAFVSVPGNLDIAAKGNYLFIDNYWDLLTFDIANPSAIQLVARKENALPPRQFNYGFYEDSARGVITAFTANLTEETIDCNTAINNRWDGGVIFLSANQAAPVAKAMGSGNGQGGSLSRFALWHNYLYIAGRYGITPIEVTNATNLQVKPTVNTPEMETLYGFQNKLLAGSPNGMFIFSLTNPAIPTMQGQFIHWRGCDPVVAEGNVAYVTIRGGGPCGGVQNVLEVLDISNFSNPTSIRQYQMNNPYGLGIANGKLGICDGSAGFKLYDAIQPNALAIASTTATNKVYDVIMDNNNAILIAEDALLQYNISNANNPQLLSKLNIK